MGALVESRWELDSWEAVTQPAFSQEPSHSPTLKGSTNYKAKATPYIPGVYGKCFMLEECRARPGGGSWLVLVKEGDWGGGRGRDRDR